jgi:hypothetical protein
VHFLYIFLFEPLIFKANKKPTITLIIQFIGIQYSPTCFGTLKYRHHRVKHDPAERGAQCHGKQRRMGVVYCDRQRGGRDIMFGSLIMAF